MSDNGKTLNPKLMEDIDGPFSEGPKLTMLSQTNGYIRFKEVLSNFRAQFQENRSIFNTPNPRLMNASLTKTSSYSCSLLSS